MQAESLIPPAELSRFILDGMDKYWERAAQFQGATLLRSRQSVASDQLPNVCILKARREGLTASAADHHTGGEASRLTIIVRSLIRIG